MPRKLLCRDWVGRKATTKRVIQSRGGSAIPEGVVVEIASTYRGRFTIRFGAIEIMQVDAEPVDTPAARPSAPPDVGVLFRDYEAAVYACEAAEGDDVPWHQAEVTRHRNQLIAVLDQALDAPSALASQRAARAQYLPAPLRDFHDQKDVFKSLHEWIGKPVEPMYGAVLLTDLRRAGCPEALVEQVREAQRISWVAGQCYVIDYVLRFLAACGWTLQRSRARLPFASLAETITARRERETALLREAFKKEPAHVG